MFDPLTHWDYKQFLILLPAGVYLDLTHNCNTKITLFMKYIVQKQLTVFNNTPQLHILTHSYNIIVTVFISIQLYNFTITPQLHILARNYNNIV